jgi:hypothetical protein
VKQFERDSCARRNGGLTSSYRSELAELRRENRRFPRMWKSCSGRRLLRQGDPVKVYPFIEAEKAGRRSVKRACELLKVPRAAFYKHLAGPTRRDLGDAELAGADL